MALETLYFKQESGLYFRTTYAIREANQDIIILGDSRANHHYVPSIISEEMGMSCYNAGRDGQGILYVEAVLRSILARKRPKLVVIDLTGVMFNVGGGKYGRLSSLLPYYRQHPEIRHIVNKRSFYEPLKMLSKIYPYNSMLLTIIKYNFVGEIDYSGFIPLNGKPGRVLTWDVGGEDCDGGLVDLNAVESLENICRVCNENGIKAVLSISPYFDEVFEEKLFRIIKDVADVYRIPVINFSREKGISRNMNYFVDSSHLNYKGAREFSMVFCERIKETRVLVSGMGSCVAGVEDRLK